MRRLLRTAELLLVIVFGIAGVMKATMPLDQIAKTMHWVPDVPPLLVRFIGVCEVAAALGLTVPRLTRLGAVLAAAGLTLLMFCATLFHLTRSEPKNAAATLTLGVLAALVAWGRAPQAPDRN